MPPKIPLPFAAAGLKNVIPLASQIGVKPGAASLQTGFPPLTMTPVEAGGIAPFGQDFNGILNLVSGQAMWFGAGGPVYYDADFAAAIGGYPNGTRLTSVAVPGAMWLNTVDNNTSNPDAGGGGWVAQYFGTSPSDIANLSATNSSLAAQLSALTARLTADENNLNNYNSGQDGRLNTLETKTGGRLLGIAAYPPGVFTHSFNGGTRTVYVLLVGGGAGGGSGPTPASGFALVGSGGSAGGCTIGVVYQVPGALGASQTITVGTGGAGQIGSYGLGGGTSSFGTVGVAYGGLPGSTFGSSVSGVGNSGAGAPVGTWVSNDVASGIVLAGGAPGTTGIILAADRALSGAGGSGPWGGGGSQVGQNQAGRDGGGPGSGGGGSCQLAGQGPYKGGDGAGGLAIVVELS